MKRLLVTIAALLVAAMALASCGNAEAESVKVSCDGNVEAKIDEITVELAKARNDAKDAEGTPAESEATARVEALDAQLAEIKTCDQAPAESTTTEAAACPDTWVRVDSDKGNNRWFAGGVPSIAAASNPDEARAAANEWANGVRQDPVLLAGAGRYLLDREVDQAVLFDGDGCATQTAVDLVAEMEAALALSTITPTEAPANGHNSGTHDGSVVGAANPGITGNRKAILIEAPNGSKLWILARCGNPVTEGPPPVPHGPTDEPTTPPASPEAPPTGLTPKDPSRDVLRNPDVPAQVRGPGTTPVGVDPGPPTAPVDSPSGCNGPCPTVPPAPPPAPGVTVPVSNGGNTGVTAPPTSAPPPAPPVTASPQTPVTSP